MGAEKVEVEKISIAEIIAIIGIAWFAFGWGLIARIFSMERYWTLMGTFLPYIYILVLIGYLGKKGMKTGKEFTLAVMFFLLLTTAKWYYFSGSAEVDIYNMISGSYLGSVVAMNFPTDAGQYLSSDIVPTWLVVLDPKTSATIWFGGGDPNWAVLMGPLVTWSVAFIAVLLVSMTMVFFIFGPQWYDVERLQWPINVPAVYTINETFPTEENKEWGRLLSFKGRNKIFWISFIVGIIINLPYLIALLFPALPLGLLAHTYFGCYYVELNQYVSTILPNAQANSNIGVFVIMIIAILPWDVGLSLLVMRVFTGFIYRPLVTRMGIVPPGIDPGTAWPWPHAVFSNLGGHIGLGILVMYITRDRWMKALGSFKEDFKVHGVSMRGVMLMMLIGTIFLIGMWVAAGGDILVTIVWFVVLTLFNIGGAYYYATLMWYGADCPGYQMWQIVFPVGLATGSFSATPPQPNPRAAFAQGLMSASSGTCVGYYEGNTVWSQTIMSASYGLTRSVGASVRKFMIYITIGFIFLVPFGIALNTYVLGHTGLVNTGQYTQDVSWSSPIPMALDQSIRSVTWSMGALSFNDMWVWTIISSIVFILIGYLRTVFPWFFLHPVGVLEGIRNDYWVCWINIVVGLLIKLTLEKALGPRRSIEYLSVILSGIVLGMGALYLPAGLYLMTTVSMPNLTTLWR